MHFFIVILKCVRTNNHSGYSNTTGQENTTIGYLAGELNGTSTNRTIVGYEAGRYNKGTGTTALVGKL